VAFNGTAATLFTVDSDAQIRATVPAGASSGPISVSNAAGTGSSAASFTVIVAPSIASFDPTSGPVGTEVTVAGSGFTGVTAVAFNGTAATLFTVDSDVQIRATVPEGATAGPISVTNPAGTAASATSFTVTVPQVTFAPIHDADVDSGNPSANTGSSTRMRIRSTSPTLNTYVKFDVTGLSGPVTSAKLRLFCINGSVDGGRINAVSNDYQGTTVPWEEGGLTWNNAPAISGTPLDQKGTVALDTWVEFDVTAAIAGNGTYSFAIWSGSTDNAAYETKEATRRPELVIEASAASPPTISDFSPTSGAVGTEVTIQGSSFATASAVAFNGTPAAFLVDGDSQLRATVPAGASSGSISVTNAAGTATSAASFTVIPPPVITGFTPTSGQVGAEVTVQGSGFATVSGVHFNGSEASFTVDSDTELRATVPSDATSGPIRVTNPAGADTTDTDFTVSSSVAVGDDEIPGEFALGRNYPNPFQARTTVDFALPRAVKVRLAIYDLLGRAVRTLVDGRLPAGVHRVSWDALDANGKVVGNGVYFLRLEAEGRTWTRRLTRVR
jgi:hypothetical protein